jgi:hypothetical protein
MEQKINLGLLLRDLEFARAIRHDCKILSGSFSDFYDKIPESEVILRLKMRLYRNQALIELAQADSHVAALQLLLRQTRFESPTRSINSYKFSTTSICRFLCNNVSQPLVKRIALSFQRHVSSFRCIFTLESSDNFKFPTFLRLGFDYEWDENNYLTDIVSIRPVDRDSVKTTRWRIRDTDTESIFVVGNDHPFVQMWRKFPMVNESLCVVDSIEKSDRAFLLPAVVAIVFQMRLSSFLPDYLFEQ